jgi:hypothetical protein
MTAFEDFDGYLQDQRKRLTIAESEALARGKRNFSGVAAEARAALFVWTAAALERFVPAFLQENLQTIEAQQVPAAELRYSLFAIACEPHFHVIRSGAVRTAWTSRLELLDLVPSSEVLKFSGDGPVDGKTIRGYHFDAIWATFGLPGSPWETPVLRNVLEDLATGRNDVAHGHLRAVEFGRRRTFEDCFKMLSRIDELVTHTCLTMDSYLSSKGYLR